MELVGRGRTADIYAWEAGRVLKLYQEWMPREAVEVEAQNTRVAYENGLPVPQVFDLIEQDGRQGMIIERVDGPTMLQVLTSKPWSLITLARKLADLHAELHEVVVERGLPSGQERYRQRIQRADGVPDDVKRAAITALQGLAGGKTICHGDFHPDNILLSARGPIIIDWIDASSGNPLSDVARTLLLLTAGDLPEGMGRFQRWISNRARQTVTQTYLRRYIQRRQVTVDEIAAWELPIVAARLFEDIEPERATMLARVQQLAGN